MNEIIRETRRAELLAQARALSPSDEQEELLLQAARLGSCEAMELLGYQYQNGEFGIANSKEAIRWYLAAAAHGSGGAMGELGEILQNGEGVRKNIFRAFDWYERGATLGDTFCQQKLEEFQQMQANGIFRA